MITTRTRPLARRTIPLTLFALAACAGGSDAPPNAAGSAAPAAAAAPAPAATPAAAGADSAPAGTAAAGAVSATEGALLDPDAATREQLLAVPGITPAAADALIAGRPYTSMTAVDRALAKQLAAAERKTVYARLWKPIDLNAATGEEILLIPGVGPRMRHEFEEYRPYRSTEQFRREIGKYVKPAELARLERYVAVR